MRSFHLPVVLNKEQLTIWESEIDTDNTVIFKIDHQLELTVYHTELCSIFCNNLNGKEIWKTMRKKYVVFS